MITNRQQKRQSNTSCIPDGDVHAFHHKISCLALKEFERESFLENVLLFSVVCLSHSLSVVLATSLLLFCVFSFLVSQGLLGLIGLSGLLGLIGLLGLKKETHETYETHETFETHET